MAPEFDRTVIGSGIASRAAARAMASVGWSVAVIDWRPLGGTCVLRGCNQEDLTLSRRSTTPWRMQGRCIAGEARIDWAELMAFRRGSTEPVPDE